MALTVQFLINWLSILIPNYNQLVTNYRKAKKKNKPTELIELIYDCCLTEAQKSNDIEVRENFHNTETHRVLRLNNIKKIKGRLKIRTFVLLLLLYFKPKSCH